MRIIGFEGVSLCGKTTAARRLVSEHHDWTYIPCFSAFLPKAQRPAHLPGTGAEERAAVRTFLAVEKLRAAQVESAAKDGKTTVIVDRTVETLLAHARWIEGIRGWRIVEELADMVDRCDWRIVPEVTCFFEPPPRFELELRARQRGNVPELLYCDEMTAAFDSHFIAKTRGGANIVRVTTPSDVDGALRLRGDNA